MGEGSEMWRYIYVLILFIKRVMIGKVVVRSGVVSRVGGVIGRCV